MSGEPLIEAVGLSAGYGGVPVVHDLDLAVHPGEVVVLLGANGAGKSTTLRTLAGALTPVGGEVRWRGTATKAPLHRRARRGIGLVTEERSVFMGLSAHANLRLGRGSVQRALELFPELRPLLRRRAGLLSGGEQQILTLARALAAEPAALLADELSLGLAPLIVRRLLVAVREAADRGVGVLLVEQHAAQALAIADRGYVVRRGRVVMSGTASELRRDFDEIRSSYLTGAPAAAT
jgi:ABC-type branched-subunit amino acid transport system ATPase component